ncbi:DUF4844 domain-containing protein [Mucilaginibacter sp.]|jgi:hypothetical protein|uniref:DUF4844 domain-containing protein n=1 Tax=Mucilaginibacter sp. TaxID=1882438 RepID=UPI0035625179
MKRLFALFLVLMTVNCYAQKNSFIVVNKDALKKLSNFKLKNKFMIESAIYQGLSVPGIQPKMNELLNKTADDFIATVKEGATEKKFQEDIKTGLKRFDPFYLNLDTEDRKKTCTYFEELMDCVGLASSGGQLNMWMYGFDPTKKTNVH